MSGLHSIWLMPSWDDAATLRSIAAELRDAFPGPAFEPHLTLVEEIEREADDLADRCRRIAEGLGRLTVPIEAVGTSSLYFRSFYVRFAPDETLVGLRERAIDAIWPGPAPAFMPHVSLLYGVDDTAEKERARQTIEARLAGRPIRFDRICVVASAKTIPIDRWIIASTVVFEASTGMERGDSNDRLQAH